MRDDQKGFKYPVVNRDLCVNCGACDRVCDGATAARLQGRGPIAYGAFSKDEALRYNSSSGGVFSIIAREVLSNGGIVVGAAMSSDCYSVHHVCVETDEELAMLRGSKYLQSDIGTIFEEIKAALDKERVVLFSGTPCQVDGLKAFLGKDYQNLLCVDIICHGVPSPLVWKKYCQEIEERSGGKIVAVNFRHKRQGWKRFGMFRKSRNGLRLSFVFHQKERDEFLRLFLKNYTLRPSCYECQHKGINRNSDMTIADFWGVERICPDLSDGKGTSLVLVHTEKGDNIFQRIRHDLTIRETDVQNAVDRNKPAVKSVHKPHDYELFWEDFDKLSIKQLARKFAPITLKTRIKLAIYGLPVVGYIKKKRRGGVLFKIVR